MAIDYKHRHTSFGGQIVEEPSHYDGASLNGVWQSYYNDDTDGEYATDRKCTRCRLQECAYYEKEVLG